MKALVYHGPKKVSVDKVPDAKLEKLTDVVIELTTTNICGSDLHMYEGRTDVEKGKILGHENLGEVVEVGKAVDTVKKGDKVVLPFNIGCGFCANCERGLTGYCLTCADPSVMPGMAGAAYGFAGMGPYSGGQAEYLRVHSPISIAWTCRKTPTRKNGLRHAVGHLSDRLARHAPGGSEARRIDRYLRCGTRRSDGGDVGSHSRRQPDLRRRRQEDRLELAKQIGANFNTKDGNIGDQIRDLTDGLGADCGSECVGYQCNNSDGKEVPNLVMNSLVDAVKATGTLGVVGVYVPKIRMPRTNSPKGQIAFDFGKFWFKGQKMGTGQCNVKAYNRCLGSHPSRQGESIHDRLP